MSDRLPDIDSHERALDALDDLDAHERLAEEEEEAQAQAPFNAPAIHVAPLEASRAQTIYSISQRIPQNEYGLPIFFYRSDLLPSLAHGYTDDDLEAAAVGLFYNEGYPTLPQGTAFWSRLPHEPMEAHLLFSAYLEQAEELGIRQIELLAETSGTPLETLRQHYMEFYWSARARAYDLFITAAEARKRQFRIRKMENSHYNKAGELLEALLTKFDDPEWMEELTAKEAIDALETLVKVQRLSVGLTGQHASSTPREAIAPGASAEVVLRQITRAAGVSEQGSNNFGDKLAAFMSDPQAAMQLQEMILRVNTAPGQFTTSQEGLID